MRQQKQQQQKRTQTIAHNDCTSAYECQRRRNGTRRTCEVCTSLRECEKAKRPPIMEQWRTIWIEFCCWDGERMFVERHKWTVVVNTYDKTNKHIHLLPLLPMCNWAVTVPAAPNDRFFVGRHCSGGDEASIRMARLECARKSVRSIGTFIQ